MFRLAYAFATAAARCVFPTATPPCNTSQPSVVRAYSREMRNAVSAPRCVESKLSNVRWRSDSMLDRLLSSRERFSCWRSVVQMQGKSMPNLGSPGSTSNRTQPASWQIAQSYLGGSGRAAPALFLFVDSGIERFGSSSPIRRMLISSRLCISAPVDRPVFEHALDISPVSLVIRDRFPDRVFDPFERVEFHCGLDLVGQQWSEHAYVLFI